MIDQDTTTNETAFDIDQHLGDNVPESQPAQEELDLDELFGTPEG